MAWELTGNERTNPPVDFIGTIDKYPLVVKTMALERMRIDANGNVGIGTANPVYKLHVEGVSLLGGPNYNSHFPWNDNNAYITGANIVFRDGKPNGWAERMRITSAGSVGIGTANPQPDMKLHVEGTSLLGGPNYNSHFPWTDNNVYITGANIVFRDGKPNGWAERMRITSAGNIGIGTAEPQAPLHIPAGGLQIGTSKKDSDNFYWKVTPERVLAGPGHLFFPSVLELYNGKHDAANKPLLSVNSSGTVGISDIVGISGKVGILSNVGIGTDSPQHSLQIGGDVNGIGLDPSDASPNAGYIRFGDNTGWKLHIGRSREAPGAGVNAGVTGVLMTIQDNGNVGIGTIEPQHRLQIGGDVDGIGLDKSDASPNAGYIRFGDNTGWKLHIGRSREAPGAEVNAGVTGVLMTIQDNGSVGIGTDSPENSDNWDKVLDVLGSKHAKLSVRTANIDARILAHDSGWWNAPAGMIVGTASYHALSFGTNKIARMTIDRDGYIHIGDNDHRASLDLTGDLNLQGRMYITGDIILFGADCAEDFDIADTAAVELGTIMVIDPDGALRPSAQAYDRRVAGVISGAGDLRPGLRLGKQAAKDGRMPLALVGRVYCKVDAQFGAVAVGDLLTTSPTAGHAMKASDPAQAFGAVIGKALKPLQSGTGIIPILVALQ